MQSSLKQRFDYGLSTYIEPRRPRIEFAQHTLRQINVYPLDGPDDGEVVREVGGNILTPRCDFRDFVGCS